jgi:hypothetical protein
MKFIKALALLSVILFYNLPGLSRTCSNLYTLDIQPSKFIPFDVVEVFEGKKYPIIFEVSSKPLTITEIDLIINLVKQKLPEAFWLIPENYNFYRNLPERWFHHVRDTDQLFIAINALSLIGEPKLVDLFPGHVKGDFYRQTTRQEERIIRSSDPSLLIQDVKAAIAFVRRSNNKEFAEFFKPNERLLRHLK